MSVKEFFAFSVLKQSVIEFLKNKGDFDALGQKYKKPFRGHIKVETREKSNLQNEKIQYVGPFGNLRPFQSENSNKATSDTEYYISDGFHQIKCQFSKNCIDKFQSKYPGSIQIENIVNMLVCVYDYTLILETPFKNRNSIIDSEFYKQNSKIERETKTNIFRNKQTSDPKVIQEK